MKNTAVMTERPASARDNALAQIISNMLEIIVAMPAEAGMTTQSRGFFPSS